jgi:hypothetical protein
VKVNRYYRLNLQRPFDIWKYSKSDGKGNLTQIVFAYDFDTQDCLMGQVRDIFATQRLFRDLQKCDASGVDLIPVITIYSDMYQGSKEMEPVMKLNIFGNAGEDDFGFQDKNVLIVSQRILDLLDLHGKPDIEVFDFDPAYKHPIPQWLLDGSSEEPEQD